MNTTTVEKLELTYKRTADEKALILNGLDLSRVLVGVSVVMEGGQPTELRLLCNTAAPMQLEVSEALEGGIMLVPRDPRGYIPVQPVQDLCQSILNDPYETAQSFAGEMLARLNHTKPPEGPAPKPPILTGVIPHESNRSSSIYEIIHGKPGANVPPEPLSPEGERGDAASEPG